MTEEQTRSQTPKLGLAGRLAIVAVLALAVAATLYFKGARTETTGRSVPPVYAQEEGSLPAETSDEAPAPQVTLPRLLDLGADKCVPCKMMAPVLEGLREEYAGHFEVVFIDVWQNRTAARKYGIQVIPTQIFFDAAGRELFRHQGFFSREDILKTWREYGFDFEKTATGQGSS